MNSCITLSARLAQTILENVGLMSFQLGGAHQLRISNTTKAGKSVKTGRRETSSKQQLLGIHYCFATGLQEKLGPHASSVPTQKHAGSVRT